MYDDYKIVEFHPHCSTCLHELKKEDEDPCFDCLRSPVNLNSRKPIRWEEK